MMTPIDGLDQIPSDDNKVGKLIREYAKWKSYRESWIQLWQDCYEYSMPNRKGFYAEHPGQARTDRIFDSTAVVSLQNFTSRIKSFVAPDFARWASLQPGPEIPEQSRDDVALALQDVEDFMFDTLQNSSNFDQEVALSLFDLAVGTGALIAEEGDADEPIKWRTVPLTELVLVGGPFGSIDGVFWPRQLRAKEVKSIWPKGKMSAALETDMKNNPERMLNFINVTLRNRQKRGTETWDHAIICLEHKDIILEKTFKGEGSNPWIIFRWSPDDVYGRGPLLQALPDIKVANLVVELILENAEMSITGMYQYGDDTVLNPHTIEFVAGTLIPVAENSRGIQPITPPGRFDISQIVLEDLQNKIRRALYDQPIGGLEQPVRSATEIAERMAEFSRETGAPFARLQKELAQPVIKRCAYILKKGGRITIPRLNGSEVRIFPVSPLGRAQEQQDIMNFDRFLEQVMARFGPEMVAQVVSPQRATKYLADKWTVPVDLLKSQAEVQAEMQQVADAGMQAVEQGMDPEQLLKLAGAA